MPIPTGTELQFEGVPVSGTNETQRIAISGSPTGGSFTCTFSGQTTASIAYSATAAEVQAALELLSNIDVGEVACAGGPLPGTAITVTFQNGLGGTNQPQMTTTDALTGGSTPASAVTTTTAGVLGTYRGAAFGSVLCDILNGVFYEQTSTSAATPTWSVMAID
jgi:hypothetical protein